MSTAGVTMNADPEQKYRLRELWTMLDSIQKEQREMAETQDKILRELSGNGGPGIRTRLYSLESEQRRANERLKLLERKQIIDTGILALIFAALVGVFAVLAVHLV